jgi:hypothetical protein
LASRTCAGQKNKRRERGLGSAGQGGEKEERLRLQIIKKLKAIN